MTVSEFSDQFDTLLNSYARIQEFGSGTSPVDITVDEYEKSVFLTRAQREFIVGFYTGNNSYGFSFEEKELVREALDALVDTYVTTTGIENIEHLNDNKHIYTTYELPIDLLWIVYEEAHYVSNTNCECANGKYVEVVPATHDELHRRLRNPFRGPRLHRVLRLNSADNLVELISDYPIGSYTLRYVKEPNPIILTNLVENTINGLNEPTTCSLPEITHLPILEMAVRMALQAKGIGIQPSK